MSYTDGPARDAREAALRARFRMDPAPARPAPPVTPLAADDPDVLHVLDLSHRMNLGLSRAAAEKHVREERQAAEAVAEREKIRAYNKELRDDTANS